MKREHEISISGFHSRHSALRPVITFLSHTFLAHGLRGLMEHFLDQLDKHPHTAITKQNKSRDITDCICVPSTVLATRIYLVYLGIGAISTPPVALSIFLMSP